MTDYILTAQRFNQILERNDQGRPIKEIKHRRGALITDLDELEAVRLLNAGAIIPADEHEHHDDGDADEAGSEGDGDPVAHGDGGAADSAPQSAPNSGAPLARPRPTATREKWEAYAKARGIDAEKVDAMANKDDIIAAVDELDAQ